MYSTIITHVGVNCEQEIVCVNIMFCINEKNLLDEST